MKQVIVWAALVLLSVTGMSQTVVYEFTGTLDYVDTQNNPLPEGYVGQSFSGWFSYSDDTHITEIGALQFTLGTFQSDILDDRCLPWEVTDQLDILYYGIQDELDFGRTGVRFTNKPGVFFELSKVFCL